MLVSSIKSRIKEKNARRVYPGSLEGSGRGVDVHGSARGAVGASVGACGKERRDNQLMIFCCWS